MIDYYLKFPDEPAALAVLEGLELLAVDHVGVIHTVTPTDDPEAPLIAELEGWHVNVRAADLVEALEPHKLAPAPVTPVRVWA